MVSSKAPGKLFIAGEYAVTEAGYPAILLAIDRFIYIDLEKSQEKGSIVSQGKKTLDWIRQDGSVSLSDESYNYKYILKAMEIVERYAKEKDRQLAYYNISIRTELQDQDGTKYGLGSSAAITVAMVESLCKFYRLPITSLELFKLSSLVNLSINPRGSCGDIASSVYGAWIYFKSFNNAWVLEKLKDNKISNIVSQDWPDLEIEELGQVKDLKFLVGWTGKPASTESLVGKLKVKSLKNHKTYEEFLRNSKSCVENLRFAFRSQGLEEIKKGIEINKNLLEKLNTDLNLEILSPKLKKLIEIVKKHGGSGKTSGAGGGDCGIGIFHRQEKTKLVLEEWKENGILPLDLRPYYKE